MTHFTESTIEQAAIDWLQELGYNYAIGPEIAFDEAGYKRAKLRNSLLPMLMRGEVLVKDVEKKL